jgi:beta-lactamase class A
MRRTVLLLSIATGFLLITTLALGTYALHLHKQLDTRQEYDLLAPGIAWLNVDEFVAEQKTLTVSLRDLRAPINATIHNNTEGEYGVYIEDLTTGAWLGINEREKFIPASLLKTPIMVAILKKAESGTLSLDQKVPLQPQDLNYEYGTLARKGVGYELTVQELLTIMIRDSDNTALFALSNNFLTSNDIIQAHLAMGLPYPTMNETISPKEYSTILRSLYYSSYLRRPFSQLGLSLLLETNDTTQLPKELPKDVKIAHKIGVYASPNEKGINEGFFHDCGIVYMPGKPYLICVMSKNATQPEANRVISEVSRITYEYMSAAPE